MWVRRGGETSKQRLEELQKRGAAARAIHAQVQLDKAEALDMLKAALKKECLG